MSTITVYCSECGSAKTVQYMSNRVPDNLCLSCRRSGPGNPNWKGGVTELYWRADRTVQKVCHLCGTEFSTSKSYKEYCSMTCSKKSNNRKWAKSGKHNRRARLKAASGYFTPEEFNSLVKLLFGMCPCCREIFDDKDFTVDHIIPLSKGGSNDISNIQPLCYECNIKKNIGDTNYLALNGLV